MTQKLLIKIDADGHAAEDQIKRIEAAIEQAGQRSRISAQHFRQMRSATDGMTDAMRTARNAFLSLTGAFGAREIIRAASQIDSLRGMMEAASGTSALAAQNMAYVQKTANQLGLEVVSTAQSFAKLNAAAMGTALQGRETQQIFTSVSKAAASRGLTADETSGALLAISQMMSKGKVSLDII